MRIALILLIALHAGIHLPGFLKAFGISEFNAIDQSVSRVSGLLWLLAFILFVITIILIVIQNQYWWLAGCIAVVFSQALIISYWSDAKYGTIANVIILVAAGIAYANYSFEQMVKQERMTLLENAGTAAIDNVSTKILPPAVQKWLQRSGSLEHQDISTIYLHQELELKLKPDQDKWYSGSADQYFTVHPPGFNWSTRIEMNKILTVKGRDKFVLGRGEMLIKLLSLLPVADVRNDTKVDQATLQRYLGEIVWFPSAALSPYIEWEHIDSVSARATMTFEGITGSGIFFFNEDGKFRKFTAMRFRDVNDSEPTEWTVMAVNSGHRNGIEVPTECTVSWKLENGPWTWLKLKIDHIEYHVDAVKSAK